MDKQQIFLWSFLVLYVIIMFAVGIIEGRKSKSIADFTVGGRNAGAWLSALSYGTAYFSAVMFVGYAGGTGLKFGLWGILAGIGNAIFGSWLAWKVLARRTRDVSGRLKLKTMPEFFEKRYQSRSLKTFAAVVIFIFMVPYSASVYKGLASIAKILLHVDDTICMIVIAVVALALLVFGGYLVQARADFIQGIVMMFGVALMIVFVVRCKAVGGLQGVLDYAKDPQHGFWKMGGKDWVTLMATVLMTSFGTWGLPQMIQKYFGIKDDAQAKRGIKISTFFAFLVAGGGYFIGSLCHKFFTADTMPPQDDIVPEMLKASNLPLILLGVVLVLLISASVSTLCSVTLTACSAVSIDLIRDRVKGLTDKKTATLTKILCALFVVCSYFVANTDTPILDMMSYSWGIISGSFLAPYVLALYYKKLNRVGAWCGVLTGFFIALVPATAKVITMFNVTNETVTTLAGKGPLFACIAMAASLAVCFVVSELTQKAKALDNDFFYTGVVEKE